MDKSQCIFQKNRSVFFRSTEEFIPKKYRGNIRNESIIDFITYGFVLPNTMLRIIFLHPGSYLEFSLMKEYSAIQGKTLKPEITNEITDIVEAENLISEALDKSIKEGMSV